MPSQSLYRKWRSRTFAELIGQEHITETLTNALRAGRIGHAYLFCGPRGTGKTSTARLLAKAVNCLERDGAEPCNHCEICLSIQESRALDLIEIDAASNRGIDEIRDLRDKVNFSPSQARYKVYILDEAHMLTTEAFNALLKTLEEPPPHAIFVLVTTEPHKIPPTITSRCQRFDFRRIALKDLLAKLNRICQEEGLAVEPAALELVARNATGSFRDAESLLDQLAAYRGEHITLAYVQRLLGAIPAQSIGQLVEHLVKHETTAGLKLINQVADEGADLRQYNREIVEYLHGLLLIKAGNADLLNVTAETQETMTGQARSLPMSELMRALKLFSQADQALRNSPQPQLPLELSFLDVVSHETAAGSTARPATAAPAATPSPAPSAARTVTTYAPASPLLPRPPVAAREPRTTWSSTPPPSVRPVTANLATPPAAPVSPVAAPADGAELGQLGLSQVQSEWASVLEGIRSQSRSIEGLLRGCEPVGIDNGAVVLGFYYPFHKERIEDPKNKVIVEKALSRVVGRNCRVRCTLTPRDKAGTGPGKPALAPQERIQAAAQDPQVRAALEIFPGAEIAEVV